MDGINESVAQFEVSQTKHDDPQTIKLGPTLAAYLFLRLGWDGINSVFLLPLVFAFYCLTCFAATQGHKTGPNSFMPPPRLFPLADRMPRRFVRKFPRR